MIEQGVQMPREELERSIVAEEQTLERRAEDAQQGWKNEPGQELYTEDFRM